MTGLGFHQTNRRMCRYVFVIFVFLCWPKDMYVQGLPSVSCEAGEVTVGEKATITCIFPTGSITQSNSNFVIKKFTASNPKDGIDIMDCFHVIGSASGIPKCIFPDKSLGYNFTFEPGNDRQTVVISSAEQSDAGEYGCDRINHMVARCHLTVKDLSTVSCKAGEVTVGEEANITCIFPAGSIKPDNSNFIVKKFTASNPRDGTDIMECFHLTISTSGIPKCCCPGSSGYNFTFVPGSDTQTVVILSAKQSDAGEYGCDRNHHMVARCNLTVKETTTAAPVTTATTDSKEGSKPPSDTNLNPGAIAGIVIVILVEVGLLGGAAYIVGGHIFRKPMVAILLPATEDKALTLAMLEKEYPHDAWIRVYTNGSPVVHYKYPDGICCTRYIKGLPFTNNRADLEALDHATNNLIGNTDPNDQIFIKTDAMSVLDALIHDANTLSVTAGPNAQIVFLTDAISVFEAATENKLPHLQKALQNIKCTALVLQWIPSHCGIYGNKEAYRMAKLGVEKEQDDNGVCDTEMKLLTDHNLAIQEQKIIFHLRTGHNRLSFHPPTNFHFVPSPPCPCRKGEQTMKHILQDCENHEPLRKEIWSKPTTLQEKLYGPVKALKKTAKFVCMMPNACSVYG